MLSMSTFRICVRPVNYSMPYPVNNSQLEKYQNPFPTGFRICEQNRKCVFCDFRTRLCFCVGRTSVLFKSAAHTRTTHVNIDCKSHTVRTQLFTDTDLTATRRLFPFKKVYNITHTAVRGGLYDRNDCTVFILLTTVVNHVCVNFFKRIKSFIISFYFIIFCFLLGTNYDRYYTNNLDNSHV